MHSLEMHSLALYPLAFMGLGPQELIIILVILLLLFGGSRLAGLGKSSGRALKEFKEETRGLRDDAKSTDQANGDHPATPPAVTNGQPGAVPPTYQQQPMQQPYPQAPQQSPYTQAPQPSPYSPTPNNLTDPPASDVRRDV